MLCVGILLSSLFVTTLCDNKDGGKAPRIPLNDGNSIPGFGFGTFLGFDENGQKNPLDREVEDPVTWALDAGYRMIDTASAYNNEEQVGKAVRASSVPREDIFVVTKLGMTEKRDVVGSLKKSLGKLNLTYVDLYLIHNPVSFTPDHEYDIIDYLDTWKGMVEAKNLGLAKSIGISNFNISQIERLMANNDVKPAVLQIEVNLNLAQNELLDYCKRQNIFVMAFSPFGSLFEPANSAAPAPRVNDATLKRIAEGKGKSVPQIVLRYLVQRGVAPIPKSVKKERIEENINIFDFELSSEEMEELGKFNKNHRIVWPTFWQDHPYFSMEQSETPEPDLFGWKKEKKE